MARRSQCKCLSMVFAAMIAIVAPSQLFVEWRAGDSPVITELFRRVPTRANLRRLENSLEDRCWIGQVVHPWVRFVRFVLLHDAGDNALFGRDGWFFYRPAVRYLIEPWSPQAAGTQGNVLDAIVSFRDELAKRNIHLLVVPAPNKASIYPEMLAARAGKQAGPVNATTKSVLEASKAARVEVLDLFAIYKQAQQLGDPPAYYLKQDSHWSPEGMQLAAEIVARRLLDLGWVEKGTTPYATRSAPVQQYGDVLKMMRVPLMEQILEPQTLLCTQVIDAESGQLYEDDADSPVLVLGDSFLRIFERDEPGQAGFVAHLAHNLGFGLTSIVSDGGASTLVRQQLSRRPGLLKGKKVVVWEFVERDLRLGTEGWQHVPLPELAEASPANLE